MSGTVLRYTMMWLSAKWNASNVFVLRSTAWGMSDVGCLGVCHRKDEHREQGIGNEECGWCWMWVCVCMCVVTHTPTYLHTHACRQLPSTEKRLMNELGIYCREVTIFKSDVCEFDRLLLTSWSDQLNYVPQFCRNGSCVRGCVHILYIICAYTIKHVCVP